ncbi:MAG: TlyA family RNA methyltransferase [Clostridiales bacterium]|nr:TlyA family RNA methyltransferase [Clostridiales bacterium]
MTKTRLDVRLCENGLFDSREKARAAVMSGIVYVDGNRELKPGTSVTEHSVIEVRGSANKFVSRGGLKLEKALDFFEVSPEGKICIDCGASTGGFTDCLLKRGASRVYAVDVGYGQLAWSIRNDPRVVTMERTNIRYVTPDQIPDKIQLAVIDVSFISLNLVLPANRALLSDDADVICLIKPQFEAGREKVGKKGVVRDPGTHLDVLNSFIKNAENSGFHVKSLTFSPIKGPEGNIEFLGHLSINGESISIDAEKIVSDAHKELEKG